MTQPAPQPQNHPDQPQDEPTKAQIQLAERIRDVLMYIGGNTTILQSDLERIKMKCDLFRKNRLCVKCVFFLDGSCVFWDKHYRKFTEDKKNGRFEQQPAPELQP